MPIIDFPNSPTVNQQFTAGGKIWQWSGTTWDVVRIAVPAASLTSTDVSRLTGATSNIQTQINTLSTNLGNTLDDYVPIGDVGVADGVASLDSSGKIPIAQLGNLIDGAPGALDTLNELAAAINDEASYAATITTTLGTKISNAGGDIITSSLASTIPLRIRGAASQTANLQEWQDSAGTVLSGIGPKGRIFAQGKTGNTDDLLYLRRADNSVYMYVDKDATLRGNFSIFINENAPTTATQAFILSGTGTRSALGLSGTTSTNPTFYVISGASQTSNLTEWRNSAGTVLAKVQAGGEIQSLGFISTYNSYFYSGDPTAIPLRVLGAASQTADLQQWRNSAGTVLAKITASGALDATAITVNGSAISGGLSPVAVSTNITMVASTRYFVDTVSARILTLPATPALGAEIELYDASNNAFTNNVSILRNGQKINGLTDDAALDINGFAVSFIYTGSTYGWRIK